ncbi:MAG: DUF3791 domain-containing protein [Phascolarctobacterium sp.]|nr:DUF3791 domain-containing protein [Phascolarctobacterium sp.]
MSEQAIKDSNLIFVATVEQYALKHKMSTEKALQIFAKHNLFSLLRSQYEVLHMLDFDDAVEFAEDVLRSEVA